jgi:hypothetical protein
MQWIVEWIRKIVILVLLMEVVLQMQAGRQYEAYIRMLIGLMVLYNLVGGIFGAFRKIENGGLKEMEMFQWSKSLASDLEERAEAVVEGTEMENESANMEVQVNILPVSEINIREIRVGDIGE